MPACGIASRGRPLCEYSAATAVYLSWHHRLWRWASRHHRADDWGRAILGGAPGTPSTSCAGALAAPGTILAAMGALKMGFSQFFKPRLFRAFDRREF